MAKEKSQAEPVWSKRTGVKPSLINLLYTAGRDIEPKPAADELLIPYDIWTNRAHCLMLYRQQIIPAEIACKILRALDKLTDLYRKNRFQLDKNLEDVHINIENFVNKDAGAEIAGWLHTGRSRNDQSTTDVRLFVRDRLLEITEGTIELMETLLAQAEKYTEAVMPGLTHLRFATTTTWSHYLLSYAQALERDLLRFNVAYSLINQSPLGAVAAYGTYWNIDRQYTAQLLGFDRVQVNTIDCMSNRWEMEAEAAVAVAFLMNHLSIISEDLLLFSLPTLNMITIDDQYVTGSSVMPQKRNLDFAEVTRAKAALIQSYAQALWGIGRGINSGYNRDEQWTKFIIIDVFDEARYASRLFRDVFATLRIDRAAMSRATELGFLNALEVADFLSASYQLPFRLAYKVVAEAVRECSTEQRLVLDRLNQVLKNNNSDIQLTETDWQRVNDPRQIINNKKHLGGPAPIAIKENITYLRQQLAEYKNWLKQNIKSLEKAKRLLTQRINELLKT